MAPAIDIRVRSSKSETRSFLLFPVREGKSPLPFYGEPHISERLTALPEFLKK
jgi:hypothetical protein